MRVGTQRRVALLLRTLGAGALIGAVFVGVLIAFVCGLHLGFAALGGGVALMVLDRREPREAFAAVDWSVLLFFAGLFVVVDGFGRTGLPLQAWTALAGRLSLDTVPGLAALTATLAIGSNLVSNVPAVMLCLPLVPRVGSM